MCNEEYVCNNVCNSNVCEECTLGIEGSDIGGWCVTACRLPRALPRLALRLAACHLPLLPYPTLSLAISYLLIPLMMW